MTQRVTSKRLKNLRLRQLDEQTSAVRRLLDVPRPPGGWVRAIRSGLGMTLSRLGDRLGLGPQGVLDLEHREDEDRITLSALRRAGEALDCDLVYALVPRRPLSQMLEQEAHAMASREIQPIAHSMRLEKQGVSATETDRQIRDRAAEILQAWPKGFWENPEP